MQVLHLRRSSAFRCGALAMSTSVGLRVAHAQTALRTAQAVCFDVDSTVVTSEGIDDLAAYLGCGDKVAALTAQAMGGSMPFHEALALRLSNLTSRPGHRLLEAISLQAQDGLINADADPRDLNGGPKAYREGLRQAALFALNRTG